MPNRRANWGSIRPLPSSRFQIRYSVDGVRHTGDQTYKTWDEADLALNMPRTDLFRATWHT